MALAAGAQAWRPLALTKALPEHPIVTDLAAKYARPPAQIILRWHIQQGIVAIPKSASPTLLCANADVFSFHPPSRIRL